ncbi:MAG: pilus assembly protein [Deltaproteobacteria bacterium]|nr:pilus assembly protein [Deltaproteobacteria bacterium]
MKQNGQGVAEYIIIVLLVVAGIVVALRYFGSDIAVTLNNITTSVSVLSTAEGKIRANKANGDAESSGSDREADVHDSTASETDSAETKTASVFPKPNESVQDKVNRLRAKRPGSKEEDYRRAFKFDWSSLSLIAALIIIVGFTVVFIRGGKKRKRLASSIKFDGKQVEDGQALVEFIFVAITFLFVLLGVIQLAMCLNAYTMVRYAAYNAARAAIVHANDPSSRQHYMMEAARISLLAIFPKHGRATHQLGIVENYNSSRDMDQNPNLNYSRQPITQVTVIPHPGQADSGGFRFDDIQSVDKAYITVKVKHHYELMMPLVNRLLFYVYLKYHNASGFDEDKQESIMRMTRITDIERRQGGEFYKIKYRIPIIAHYTMPLQTDFIQ